MGREVISLSVDNVNGIKESCIVLQCSNEISYTEEYEVPYKIEILVNIRKNKSIPDTIEIIGLEELLKNINNKDCLPDVGLLNYKNNELELELENVTLRELYKSVLEKILS